jgi:actin-like ATPase involved in cell morphogenesis
MSDAAWTLSIDFGTSFTVAATARPGSPPEPVYFGAKREPTMPSGVFAEPEGGLFTGTMAANKRQLNPDLYIPTPKRLLDAGVRTIPLPNGPLSIVRIVSAVMGEAAARASELHDGTAPFRTVVTHPADWDPELQRVLVTAAREAGLTRVRVLVEPVAAALHLGREGRGPGDHIAVYDLGGGTFDAAVLRRTAEGFEVAAKGGQTIGGEWFDELLRQQLDSGPLGQIEAWRRLSGLRPDKTTDFPGYVAWRKDEEQLKENIRFTKEVLSDEKSWELIIPGYAEGWTVTREALESCLREPLIQTVDVLVSTVADAGLRAEQLAAVYLVGGASRIPLVRELLWERFPEKVVNRKGDPQTVVALGAAGAYEDAEDPDQPRKPPIRKDPSLKDPPRKDPPKENGPGLGATRPWQSRLAIAPAGPRISVRLDRYEVTGLPYFGILARRQKDRLDTFGGFVEAQERTERAAGWTLTPPKAVSVAGAELGLTQRESGRSPSSPTIARVYASASRLLITAWSSDVDGTQPGAGVESLSVQFRTTGTVDRLDLGLKLPRNNLVDVRETLVAQVRLSLFTDYTRVTVESGPLPVGIGNPEQMAEHCFEEFKKSNPGARLVLPASPGVFLRSRLCVSQRVKVSPKGRLEQWWTGLTDSGFVWIAVAGGSTRLAERIRDMVTLR